jgi:hypothetical protein
MSLCPPFLSLLVLMTVAAILKVTLSFPLFLLPAFLSS